MWWLYGVFVVLALLTVIGSIKVSSELSRLEEAEEEKRLRDKERSATDEQGKTYQ